MPSWLIVNHQKQRKDDFLFQGICTGQAKDSNKSIAHIIFDGLPMYIYEVELTKQTQARMYDVEAPSVNVNLQSFSRQKESLTFSPIQ